MYHGTCLQTCSAVLVESSALLRLLRQQVYGVVEVFCYLVPALLLRITRLVYLVVLLADGVDNIEHEWHTAKALHHLVVCERSYGKHLALPFINLSLLEVASILVGFGNEVVEFANQLVLVAERVYVVCRCALSSSTTPLAAERLTCKASRHTKHPEVVVQIVGAVAEVLHRELAVHTCQITRHATFRTKYLLVINDIQWRDVQVCAG